MSFFCECSNLFCLVHRRFMLNYNSPLVVICSLHIIFLIATTGQTCPNNKNTFMLPMLCNNDRLITMASNDDEKKVNDNSPPDPSKSLHIKARSSPYSNTQQKRPPISWRPSFQLVEPSNVANCPFPSPTSSVDPPDLTLILHIPLLLFVVFVIVWILQLLIQLHAFDAVFVVIMGLLLLLLMFYATFHSMSGFLVLLRCG